MLPGLVCRWQSGDNNSVGLPQLGLEDEVVLVEVVDAWDPDPSASPVRLHRLDGSVAEIVR